MGALPAAGGTVRGDLTVTGDTGLQATTVTLTASGDISGVNETLSGTLGVTGAITGTTATFSGQVTIPGTPGANTDAASKDMSMLRLLHLEQVNVTTITPGNGLTSSSAIPDFVDGSPITEAGVQQPVHAGQYNHSCCRWY